MSAARSFVDVPVITADDPRVILYVATALTESRLARLSELEGELVDLLDAMDVVRDEIARGQAAQITLIRLLARREAR